MKLVLVALTVGGLAHADPKVPQEVTDLAKTVTGTWKCSGTMQLPGETEAAAMTATLRSKLELDGFWIHDTFEAKVGKTAKVKYESFTTFDARKWRRVMVDNRGTQVIGTCDAMKDGKMDFNLDLLGGAGPAQFRDHLDATDPKLLKLAGEVSSDKGKTWTKVYEMSCKK